MAMRRDYKLVGGGLLIGLAIGLYLGLILLVFAVMSMMHHMFIMGIQWFSPAPVLLVLLPSSLVVCGTILLRRGLRNTQ